MPGSLKLAQPGKPVAMLSDGVWVYVVYTDTSGPAHPPHPPASVIAE